MSKIVSFDERDLRAALDGMSYRLTSDQKMRVINHLMEQTSTRTPRQIAEVKQLRNRIEQIQRTVKGAISLCDNLSSTLDNILSFEHVKDVDES